jgi:hypothetical protein
MRVWADLLEWRDIYADGPGSYASPALQALYAARAAELKDACTHIDRALHVLRMFV